MKNKKRLTESEFNSIRTHLRKFSEKNIDAIHRILVGGIMQKEVASELEMTKEAVSAMVSRAWKIHLLHGQRPSDWRTIEVVLPPEYAEVIEDLADILRTRAKK